MSASVENPKYTVYIITSSKRYNVTNALISLDISEPEGQMAVSVSLNLYDADVNGSKLSDLIFLRNRVVVLADDGKKSATVFTGYVWDISPKETLVDAEFTVKCYDNLIYWQESEDSDFFPEGKSTKDIVKSIATKWGIGLTYEYESITHEKLVLRGFIADFMTGDLLDTVKNRTRKKYIIRSHADRVIIRPVGSNETIYKIKAENNAIECRSYVSLNGMITKVVILGTESDDSLTPVEGSYSNGTHNFGTLQKIISTGESMTLEEAKKEALNIINENSYPKWEYDISAADIPWIRKGDKVHVEIGKLKGYFIVKGIGREISNRTKTMTLTVVKA